MATEVTTSVIPDCQVCPHASHLGLDGPAHPAQYDAKTVHGPWAYMCQNAFDAFGIGLGTGRGQKLLALK